MSAIENYAKYQIQIAIERSKRISLEKFNQLTQSDFDNYYQGQLQVARQLASDIEAGSPDIVKRIYQGLLHPDNRSSRAVFSEVTGVTLPPQSGKTWETLQSDPVWGPLLKAYEAEIEERQAAHKLQREAERAEKQAKHVASITERILASQSISGEELLDIARHVGLAIHPRTAGTLKSRVVSIGNGTARVIRGHLPDTIWQLYRDVKTTIDTTPVTA